MDYIKAKSNKKKKAEISGNDPDLYSTSNPEPIFLVNLGKCFKKICQENRLHARILNYHYLGYNVKEICQRLNLTQANFYTILMRARRRLEKCLEKGEQ